VGLSLFWLTQWGASALDVELFNRANTYQGLAEAMKRELSTMRAQIERMGRIGKFVSANEPGQHTDRLFGVDCATTVPGLTTHEHATISTAGEGRRLTRTER
jgi:hypothetical protein